MIEDLKPYPEYKESGVPWFGNVPAHWKVNRFGSVFYERGEMNEKRHVADVLSVLKDRGVIPYAEKGRIGNKASEDISRYKIVRPDDLVLNCMNVIIGSVGRSRFTGCLSPVYYVLKRRNQEDNARFLELVFLHKPFHQSLIRIGNGILAHRMRIPMEKLKAEPFPVPPPDEQAAIVRFLDHANGKIERAIRAKRKLIALLNEQKQAIIHRAVTRGLDPNVKLKPSGIPWLGDVPEPWPIRRAKILFKQVVPPIPEGAEQVTCFRDGQVTLRKNRRTTGFTNAIWELGYQGIQPGQLVLHSMDAFAGAIGVSDSAGKCSPEYVICDPAMAGILPNYYGFLLRSLALRGMFVALCPSVRERAPRVRYSDFSHFAIPQPPEIEQEQIVGFIQMSCRSVALSLIRTEREIALLREYRTRLTADVVTGKVDVREAVKRLPTEAEEPLSAEDLDVPEDEDEIEEEA